MNRWLTTSFSCECKCEIDSAVLQDLLVPKNPDVFELFCSIEVPNRRHKKRRIQKKWIKRYGVTKRDVSMGNWRAEMNPLPNGEMECTLFKGDK